MQSLLYFLLWAGIIFFMMRFGCGAHVMGHGHRHRHDGSEPRGGGHSMTPTTEAKDPVCGMTVQTATAKTTAYQNRVYYFCSNSCRDKFEASPATYAAAVTEPHKEHHHGCR